MEVAENNEIDNVVIASSYDKMCVRLIIPAATIKTTKKQMSFILK